MQAPPVVVMPCGVSAFRRLSDSVSEAGFSTHSSGTGFRPASAGGKAQHSAARGVTSYALSTPSDSEASSGGAAAKGMSLSAWKDGSSSAGQRKHRLPGGKSNCSLRARIHEHKRRPQDISHMTCCVAGINMFIVAHSTRLASPLHFTVGGGVMQLHGPHPRLLLVCMCVLCVPQTRQGLNTAAGAWQLRPCQQQSSNTRRARLATAAAAPRALPAHTGSCK